MIVTADVPIWGWVLVAIGVVSIVLAVLCLIFRPRYFPLNGKVIVITGGSSGIGKAAATAMLQKGASVALLARKESVLAEAARELTPFIKSPTQRITVHSADVTDEARVTEAMANVAKAHGGVIDVLINSAGISMPRRFEETPASEFMDVYRLNVLGTRNATLAALPYMSKQKDGDGGRIILVSSQAGLAGIYGYTAYSASKFALNGFAQALQHEVYARNIRVSLCFPPDTDTPLLAQENLQKPHITRLLSEATATVPADTVGVALAQGCERWAPLIPIGFDGWMLSTLTVGMGPAGSLWDALVQVFTMGLWRLIGLFYVQYFFSTIAKHDTVPVSTSAAQGAAKAAVAANAAAGGAAGGNSSGLTGGAKSLSVPLVSEEDKDK